MRRGISLAIAVVCAAAAVALPSPAVPRPLAALVAGSAPLSSSSHVSARATPPPAAALQQRLTALLAATVGSGRAAVTVNAIVDGNRVSAQSLRYARRAVPVENRFAQTRTAGYSARSGATTWAHSATVTRTTFAAGGVRQLHIGLVVSAAVPRVTARRLARIVAVAAGVNRARGDTLAVTRVRFATRRPAPGTALIVPAALRWAVLAAGVLAFLFTLMPDAGERVLI
jgi:flagellar biosynthesis/type III secretory pathway M-ring protein FliF/YscJ